MGAALGYFLTFSTYGTHLRGSAKGWVDPANNRHGSPMYGADQTLVEFWAAELKDRPLVLEAAERGMVLEAVLGVCQYRGWQAHAVHVRSTHVHAVVAGDVKPEKMLTDFKSYATRALRSKLTLQRRRYWTFHGSTRYL